MIGTFYYNNIHIFMSVDKQINLIETLGKKCKKIYKNHKYTRI